MTLALSRSLPVIVMTPLSGYSTFASGNRAVAALALAATEVDVLDGDHVGLVARAGGVELDLEGLALVGCLAVEASFGQGGKSGGRGRVVLGGERDGFGLAFDFHIGDAVDLAQSSLDCPLALLAAEMDALDLDLVRGRLACAQAPATARRWPRGIVAAQEFSLLKRY